MTLVFHLYCVTGTKKEVWPVRNKFANCEYTVTFIQKKKKKHGCQWIVNFWIFSHEAIWTIVVLVKSLHCIPLPTQVER